MASFFSLQNWQALLKSDFNRGYLCALALVAALLVVMMIIKFIWWLIFREYGCSKLTIGRTDGDIIVSRSAVCSTIENALRHIAALKVRKVRIFQRGKNCSITLLASFDGTCSVSELVEEVKQIVIWTLRDTFGVENVRRVKVVIEALENDEDDEDDETASVPPKTVVIQPMTHHGIGTGL